VRFSRHAKNRMRREGLARETIEAINLLAVKHRVDTRGNPIVVGRDTRGRPVEVVVALDDSGYVITVIVRRKQR
jgi:Domain of unknown function (DUF4258)